MCWCSPAALRHTADIALGAMLAAYDFRDHKTGEAGEAAVGSISFALPNAGALKAQADDLAAVAEGVFFARDLVNEPANVLTTSEFARRLEELSGLGLKVSVLDEARMAELGMGALLGVGQGSESPSKLVVMEWQGGAEGAAPLALVGKGVVFDTGGISIKPAAGMEEMKGHGRRRHRRRGDEDAGDAQGHRQCRRHRRASSRTCPTAARSARATSSRSMSGQTIEVINTDAEGRLVLADVLWYAQETFAPAGGDRPRDADRRHHRRARP